MVKSYSMPNVIVIKAIDTDTLEGSPDEALLCERRFRSPIPRDLE